MVTDDTPLLPATEEHLVRQLLASFWPSHAFGVQHIGLLGGGYMNRNYSVLNSTTSFALRRYDYNTNPPVIRYEHSLLRFLPERLHRAAVPRPLPTINGATIANRRGRY